MTLLDFPRCRPLDGAGGVVSVDPSLLDRLPLRASFCSHRWQGAPFFDPFYCSITDAGERRALLQFKRAHGVNAVVLAPRYAYAPITNASGLRARDMSWSEFLPFVEEVVAAGLFPHTYLIGDRPPAAVDNGELKAACSAMRHLAAVGYFATEWENSRTGVWTSKQVSDGVLRMRAWLGDDALLVVHGAPGHDVDARLTGASWPVEADDPAEGDEPGWWYTEAGLETDIWDWQSRHGALGPADTLEPFSPDGTRETWLFRLIEGAERFLPSGTINYFGDPVRTKVLPDPPRAPVHPDAHPHIAPDWFAAPRRRGRPVLCAFEDVPYEYSRGQVTEAHVAAVNAVIRRTGLTSLGCLAFGGTA